MTEEDKTMKTIRETIGTFDATIHGTTLDPMTHLNCRANPVVVMGTTNLRIVLQDGVTSQELRTKPILR